MIALAATLKIDPANADAFEAAFIKVAGEVRANEPGNQAYSIARSRTEPGTYRLFEVYSDDAALKAHTGSDHFKAFRPTLLDMLVAAPETEKLDLVV